MYPKRLLFPICWIALLVVNIAFFNYQVYGLEINININHFTAESGRVIESRSSLAQTQEGFPNVFNYLSEQLYLLISGTPASQPINSVTDGGVVNNTLPTQSDVSKDNIRVQTSSTTTQPVTRSQAQIVERVVVERIIEKTPTIINNFGINEKELAEKLSQLDNTLRAEMYRITSVSNTSTQSTFQALSLGQRIDSLNNTTITNPNISGATITNSTFSGSMSGTTGSFSGGLSTSGNLSGDTLTVTSTTATSTISGILDVSVLNTTSTTATSTFSNGIQLTGGCFRGVTGACITAGGGGGGATTFAELADVGFNPATVGDGSIPFTSGGVLSQDNTRFVWDNTNTRLGIGTTTPGATLSVAGNALFDNNVSANTFTATSTTATSTFPYLSSTQSDLGTIVGGTWNGSSIADAYIDDNITVSNYLLGADWYATTTDALAEGSTNLYWTNGRFDTRLSATTTLPNLTTLLGLTNASTSQLTVSGPTYLNSTVTFNNGTAYTFPSSDGSNGQVLTTNGGGNITWSLVSGGSGGSGNGWSTTTDDLVVYPTDPTDVVVVGGSATTTEWSLGTILEVIGNSVFGGDSTTTGTHLASNFTATSTTATSTFAWGIQANALNILSTTASSTFANGIQLTGGCFADSTGNCIGGAGVTTFLSLTDTPNSYTAGSILFTSGSAVTEDNTNLLWDNTDKRLGIGTTTPGATLSVAGSGIFDNNVFADVFIASSTTATSTFANGIQLTGGCFQDAIGNCIGGGGGSLTGGTTGQIAYFSDTDIAVGTSSIFISPDGNIGIGTTTPGATLSVAGNALFDNSVSANTFTATSTTATSTFAWGIQANALNILSTTASSTFANGIQLTGGCFADSTGVCMGGGSLTGGTTGQIAYFSGTDIAVGTSSIFISPNGNIGIGTTTPTATSTLPWKLQMNGTRPSFALSDSSAGVDSKHWLFSSMGGNLYIGTSTDAYATSTISVLTVLNGGYVGIGTTTPGQRLSVEGSFSVSNPPTDVGTGGTITSTTTPSGTYTVHTFTSSGTLVLPGDRSVEYLVVAGGGGGGTGINAQADAGGGGAGGVRTGSVLLNGGSYTITVGAGGASATNGSNSSIGSSVVSIGGGRGAGADVGSTGGSGGGGASGPGATNTSGYAGTSGQGNSGGNGGTGAEWWSGGGGGASTSGTNGSAAKTYGGNGILSTLTYSYYGGGGGGSMGAAAGNAANGGIGGGGNGDTSDTAGTVGAANTGGGGGGGVSIGGAPGRAGGSGIVIVRYLSSGINNGGFIISPGTGYVGIGQASPITLLDVGSGQVKFDSYTSCTGFTSSANGTLVCTSSDQRLKDNILPLDKSSALNSILALNPVSFEYIESSRGAGTQLGFLGQEVQEIFPEAVTITNPTIFTPEGTLSVNYPALISPIIASIQAINASTSPLVNNLFIDSVSGNIGIGTTTPEYNLQVEGDIAANSFINVSTKDEKNDINYLTEEDNEGILKKIMNLNAATYHYNRDTAENKTRLGVIAEEAPEEILADSGRGVDLYKMVTFILSGIKAQQVQIERLTALVGGVGDRIIDMFTAKKITATDNLCVGSTCVTEEEFNAVFKKTNQNNQIIESDIDIVTIDTEAPIITINGNNPSIIFLNSQYVDLGAIVTDNIDKNLGIKTFVNEVEVQAGSQVSVDTSVVGTTIVEYTATDNAGNTATSTREVVVGEVVNNGDNTTSVTKEVVASENE